MSPWSECVGCRDVESSACTLMDPVSRAPICDGCNAVLMRTPGSKLARKIEKRVMATRPKPVKPWFWRVWAVFLAFYWHGKHPKLSAFAWRLSRAFATEKTQMKLAAYCSGVMMDKRMAGEYEDQTDYEDTARLEELRKRGTVPL